jgi:ribonuclease BN (tRNA processing enzyme)
MQVKLLGAHQGESLDTRFMSILVDGRLAIDAGGLTSTTTIEEQLKIEAVLITHRHYDHLKDLIPLAHNAWLTKPTHIYCIDATRRALQDHIFNDVVWPSMSEQQGGLFPVVFHAVEPGRTFDLLGYTVTPIEMSHTVPTVGYLVERGGSSFFYTADTRGDGNPPWADIRPDLLLAETTMASRHEEVAHRVGHLTPQSLGRELRAFHARQGYYPRTVCVHINPAQEAQVRRELAALADELQVDISPGREGMVIEL